MMIKWAPSVSLGVNLGDAQMIQCGKAADSLDGNGLHIDMPALQPQPLPSGLLLPRPQSPVMLPLHQSRHCQAIQRGNLPEPSISIVRDGPSGS